MATFGDLAAELVGRVPGLSPFLAQTFILRSYRTVREKRLWMFLSTDGAVVCPVAISTGTAAIVFNSTAVTLSAAAAAALAAVAAPAATALQIRFMGLGTTSQIYNIAAFANPGLTLDRACQEPTNAASAILIYRAYITPPISDFLRWDGLVDMQNGIDIGPSRLTYSSAYFDARDPQRQAFGLGYYLGLYKSSSALSTVSGAPIYELWPGCTQGQTFYVRFRRRGTDPGMNDPVPETLPSDVIVQLALADHALPHAQVNAGHFPAMQKVDWVSAIELAKNEYKERLAQAKITDNEMAEQNIISRGHRLKGFSDGQFPYPIDSNFFQSHPVFWLGLFCMIRLIATCV